VVLERVGEREEGRAVFARTSCDLFWKRGLVEPHVQRLGGAQAPSLSVSDFQAFRSIGKPITPHVVEHALALFCRWCAQNVNSFRGHRNLSPPGESFLAWYDETRILEVNGILLAAPHASP
jgi:hypothetical protein